MYIDTRPAPGVLPGEWDPPQDLTFDPSRREVADCDLLIWGPSDARLAFILRDVLSSEDCDKLIEAMENSGNLQPVSIQGRTDILDDRVGSVRATTWSRELADQIWEKIKDSVPEIRAFSEFSPTDWFHPTPHKIWEPVGVSPVLRFMRYEKGGQHFAHYDAGYDYQGDCRTLMSLVFYLSSHSEEEGGATRFIADGQDHLRVFERDHNDWIRPVREDEVIAKSCPRKGSVLVFDHRMCHDVEEFKGDKRYIIRASLVFRALSEN